MRRVHWLFSLIAVVLRRLRMSVADCITTDLSLSDRVFRKTEHRVTVKGKVQGRFDSEELARAVREVVKQQALPEDALLQDASDAGCKVFVCATSKETSETVCLTSYRTPRGSSDLLNSVTIWEACRATSAATSFFDPIAVGRFGEEFVDGATGANNPVHEMWDQAQLAWGPEPLEGRVKCVVSIGTGVPSLKPFKDDVPHIGDTLVAIATETEQTAERFRRERSLLDRTGRYYRFNVLRGLEDIGLEEAKKVKEMAAATRRYIGSQEVHKQMQACAGSVAGREYFGEYRTVFSLEGVPRARQFVDRPTEMAELERVLMPRAGQSQRQNIHVLRGLGGMGKTQLAVEFARRHHGRFSSVFWLDGRSEDTLRRSIANCAGRIPPGQIAETSRMYAADSSADVDVVVKDIMAWLARPDNSTWLLIFDNVDREHKVQGGDPDAYDVKRYLSGADHGSVLVTTRLARLEQLGESQHLGKVGETQAKAILDSWYKQQYNAARGKQLLERLDGLPLAIAQAGAYLQESGVELTTYLRFYEQQWDALMEAECEQDTPLQDYPDRSVWTTWIISYAAVRDKHEATANLLLLWLFLDNKGLWYGLFAGACSPSAIAKTMLSEWIGQAATSELASGQAMRLLRSYSLVEVLEDAAGYATHPVVHRWAHHHQAKRFASELGPLAVVVVGWAVPDQSFQDGVAIQRRLLPHAQMCSSWFFHHELEWDVEHLERSALHYEGAEKDQTLVGAISCIRRLLAYRSKLVEAVSMHTWALQRYEEVPGQEHILTLKAVGYLGMVYMDQSKLMEAERTITRAYQGLSEMQAPMSKLVLQMAGNLGMVYKKQDKLEEAECLFKQVLQEMEADTWA
ncbi:unnamed protein product [Alternaria alternata]